MESSSSSSNRPSPRQLQGPRPTPLKVRKDSHKISKKPPQIPNNPQVPSPAHPQPPRPPVIIYTVSPKIIHTNPADFMTLVQRLTGPTSSDQLPSPTAAVLSPAARFAAIERADRSLSSPRNIINHNHNHHDDLAETSDAMIMLDRHGPGILSPLPSSLQPISSSFFSPIANFDPGSLNFLNDLSPGPAAFGYNFLPSPNNLFATPTVPSPGSYPWDLFSDI